MTTIPISKKKALKLLTDLVERVQGRLDTSAERTKEEVTKDLDIVRTQNPRAPITKEAEARLAVDEEQTKLRKILGTADHFAAAFEAAEGPIQLAVPDYIYLTRTASGVPNPEQQ